MEFVQEENAEENSDMMDTAYRNLDNLGEALDDQDNKAAQILDRLKAIVEKQPLKLVANRFPQLEHWDKQKGIPFAALGIQRESTKAPM